jgi:hypothetical protein
VFGLREEERFCGMMKGLGGKFRLRLVWSNKIWDRRSKDREHEYSLEWYAIFQARLLHRWLCFEMDYYSI